MEIEIGCKEATLQISQPARIAGQLDRGFTLWEDGKEIGPLRLPVLIRLAPLAKLYGKCQSLLVATPEVVTITGNIFHSCSAVEQFLYTVKLHQEPLAGLLVIRSKFCCRKMSAVSVLILIH
jgi:hypothetical protein